MCHPFRSLLETVGVAGKDDQTVRDGLGRDHRDWEEAGQAPRNRKVRLQCSFGCQAHSSEMRDKEVLMGSKFVIADPRKCVGCKACMAACLVKHFVPGDVPIPRLNVVMVGDEMTAPILCHHCEDAPCAEACPTGALYHDGDRVAVKLTQCIGCRSCVMACPFGAVTVSERYQATKVGDVTIGAGPRAVVVKCDRCADRKNGPACIEACTSEALRLITQEELDAHVKGKQVEAAAAAQDHVGLI